MWNKWNQKKILILIVTLRFSDWLIQLYMEVTGLFNCLAQQNDNEMVI